MKTTYIVQTFTRQGAGRKSRLVPDTPMQFNDSAEAIRRAEGFSKTKTGVIAISQQYDEETGEMGEGKVLAQYGEVPAGVAGYDD